MFLVDYIGIILDVAILLATYCICLWVSIIDCPLSMIFVFDLELYWCVVCLCCSLYYL